LRTAHKVWSVLRPLRGLKVPDWYCIYRGTAPWILTQASGRISDQRKALAFIVRMNYILDSRSYVIGPQGSPHSFGSPSLPRFLSRRLASLRQSLTTSMVSCARLLSWAHSPFFNWREVLKCTLSRYVDLALSPFSAEPQFLKLVKAPWRQTFQF